MKFRINDPVRIIARPSRHFDAVGTVCDVDREHPTLPYQVAGLDGHALWFGPNELVLAEYTPAETA